VKITFKNILRARLELPFLNKKERWIAKILNFLRKARKGAG